MRGGGRGGKCGEGEFSCVQDVYLDSVVVHLLGVRAGMVESGASEVISEHKGSRSWRRGGGRGGDGDGNKSGWLLYSSNVHPCM